MKVLKWLCAGLTALVLLASIACGQSDEDKATKVEERRQGFHCLSDWDGNHDGLEALVRTQLNDPSSMETYNTGIGQVVNGQHRIEMEFGARNAFGGMVRGVALGWVDHETCEATLDSIE
jgi:hypothetical protein